MALIPDIAVKQSGKLSPMAWLLYCFYCMKRNKSSGSWNCPKTTVLEDMREMSEPAYFRAKRELINEGWIDAKRDLITPLKGFGETINSDSPSDVETIKFDSLVDSETISSDSLVDSDTINFDSETINSDSPLIILPALLPTNVKLVSPTSPDADSESAGKQNSESDARAVFDRWRVVTNQPKARYLPQREKRIKKGFQDGFDLSDLMLALDGWKKSKFHQGDNPTNTVYNKIDTIFRDGEQIEYFAALARPKTVANAGNFVRPELPEVRRSVTEGSLASY